LRIFGCTTHVHVPDEKRCKLDAKSLECIYLGYAENKKAFVCLHRPSSRILESRDVVFEEGDSNGPTCVNINVNARSDDQSSHLLVSDTTGASRNTSALAKSDEDTQSSSDCETSEESDEESEMEVECTVNEPNDLHTHHPSPPIDTNIKLIKLSEAKMDIKGYQSALRALMYAMLATQPDLAFAVGTLSQHAATPGHAHVTALK
jgi:hypothetical protein